MSPVYLRIADGEPLPEIAQYRPFKATVVLNAPYSADWQSKVSDWLVASGCLYMVAWGDNSTTWDDSVDHANLQPFDYGDIPPGQFVFTTWHDDQPLEEAFGFAKYCAEHDAVDLTASLIIDVSQTDRSSELIAAYDRAWED